jgi:hypothetical protein
VHLGASDHVQPNQDVVDLGAQIRPRHRQPDAPGPLD